MDREEDIPKWEVVYSRKADKQIKALPEKIRFLMITLAKEMSQSGPVRRNWNNFGALKGKALPDNTYHCHLKKGNPTYVSCWFVVDKKLKKIEVIYVGTHENAPY